MKKSMYAIDCFCRKISLLRTSLVFTLFLLAQNLSAQVPAIASFSPARGRIGSTVTITGNNFSATAGDNIVYFGDVQAVVTNATVNTLTVIVPAGTTYRPLSVTVHGLTTYSSGAFDVMFPGNSTPLSTYSFSPRLDATLGFVPAYFATTDLDNDGRVDMVVVNSAANFISVLKNNSTIGSSLSRQISTTTPPQHRFQPCLAT